MEAVTQKIVTKDPALKIAHKRMSVLQLAETLGNITEACRRGGMDRNSFYEWKRRFQTLGLEGLKDLPTIHKSHPQTTPENVVNKILQLAIKHPSKGCQFISHLLSLEGVSLSKVTVQEILNKHSLGSRYDRWLALERHAAEQKSPLSGEQLQLLEKMNPCFRERHVESSSPGELLCQDTFDVGTINWSGQDLLAGGDRHLRLLRLRLPAHLQASRAGGLCAVSGGGAVI